MNTLAHLLQRSYSTTPEKVAIYLQRAGKPDLPITYRALIEGAYHYTQTYNRVGIQPAEVVVLILQHGEELIYSFWGAVLHGAIPSIMPFLTEKLSPERYQADLSALISITKPSAIVTYPEFEDEIKDAARTGKSSVRAIICTDRVEKPSPPDFSRLRGLHCSPDDVVLLQHSSGTTGLQKGVALSHRAVLNQLDAYCQTLKLDRDDVIVSWLPLYHDMGLIAGYLMPVLLGIPLVLMSPFDWVRAPYRLMQAISQYRGTLSWLPNFAYNFCAQKIRERHLEDVDLSSWRAIINCSEPVRWESHRAFYEKFKEYGLLESALQTSYAMAENVFAVTQSDLSSQPAVDLIDRDLFLINRIAQPAGDGRLALTMMSSGRPIPNTRIRVLDEKGQDVQERVIGEIAIQSDCILNGYYNRPDATKKAFMDGWFLTGDFGYLADGELFVTGRKKDMIIVGGKNIYPQDLEILASEAPNVHPGRVVAFGLFNEASGTEEVIIVAEADTQDPVEQQRIADAIRLTVTKNSAIALRHVHIVGPKWVLKTSSGKVARSANREKYLKELQAG